MVRRQHGFSLVEVIVALSLMSLLLASLYSAFGAVARTNTAASSVQRDTRDRRLGVNALRALIANAVPLTERRNDRTQVLFDGDRSIHETSAGNYTMNPVISVVSVSQPQPVPTPH